MCLSEAFYNIVSTFLQSLSKALHTFKPASCLLNADNYCVSFLSFKGLNTTTQTFLLVHHAPLNCQLVFHDSLFKKKNKPTTNKQKHGLENIFTTKYSFSWHLLINWSKQSQNPTNKAPHVFSLQPGCRRWEPLYTQHVFLKTAQCIHITSTRKPFTWLPQEIYFYYLRVHPTAFKWQGENSPILHSGHMGTTLREEIQVFNMRKQWYFHPRQSSIHEGWCQHTCYESHTKKVTA